ncbi:hypothetical protein E2C01_062620 [Portunus trituberculatus]|uniref:Uncharacterized protein n=1 Tax=Portunus trituberculatus TaxID=210409 RepID=A0A5B7HF60_PORTR|nr:hypothetical protein [Portunus trituberculatus]
MTEIMAQCDVTEGEGEWYVLTAQFVPSRVIYGCDTCKDACDSVSVIMWLPKRDQECKDACDSVATKVEPQDASGRFVTKGAPKDACDSVATKMRTKGWE